MITSDRLSAYLQSLDTGSTDHLEELEESAVSERVPIIRRETQNLIKTLLALSQPKRVLEVGTAVGFSTLLICTYGPAELHVTTIENYEPRIREARKNFAEAGRQGQITLLEGDAGALLPELEGPFDLIFMDAAKGQYIHWLPELLRLLAPGGLLLSDNVLQEGDILESHFLVERRNRTIHRRMREYLYALTHSDILTTTILPIGDGVTVSVKNREIS